VGITHAGPRLTNTVRFPRAARAAGLALGLAAALLAQSIPNLGDTTSPAPAEPGHALIGGVHETVNPANGSLTLSFDIPMPPGRGGFTPAFTIAYSSAGSHPFGSYGNNLDNMYAQQSLLSSDGWSYGAPVVTDSATEQTLAEQPNEECTVSSNYIAQMPDGSRQQLQLSVTGITQGTRPNPDDPCTDQFPNSPAAPWPAGPIQPRRSPITLSGTSR
jgi:hypothetical protein